MVVVVIVSRMRFFGKSFLRDTSLFKSLAIQPAGKSTICTGQSKIYLRDCTPNKHVPFLQTFYMYTTVMQTAAKTSVAQYLGNERIETVLVGEASMIH